MNSDITLEIPISKIKLYPGILDGGDGNGLE